MTQALKEEQEVYEWIQERNITEISQKTGVTISRIHYFKSGKAKNPSFEVVRELMLYKKKTEK